jgi:hypothetical protein
MRLGVGFNVFSGVELLKPAILSIRPLVEMVVVVYSKKAITGELGLPFLLDMLYDMKRENLVDAIIQIEHSTTKVPLEIQAEKRKKYELARQYCEDAGCTHFMGRDCDEFFGTSSLLSIMNDKICIENDMVVCPVLDYIKTPLLRAKNTGLLHVTVFHKAHLQYCPIKCTVLVDMSRTVSAEKIVILSPEELVMHHMTGVRYNEKELARKFQGHTHFCDAGQGNALKFTKAIEESSIDSLQVTTDHFGILQYWQNEYKTYYGRL